MDDMDYVMDEAENGAHPAARQVLPGIHGRYPAAMSACPLHQAGDNGVDLRNQFSPFPDVTYDPTAEPWLQQSQPVPPPHHQGQSQPYNWPLPYPPQHIYHQHGHQHFHQTFSAPPHPQRAQANPYYYASLQLAPQQQTQGQGQSQNQGQNQQLQQQQQQQLQQQQLQQHHQLQLQLQQQQLQHQPPLQQPAQPPAQPPLPSYQHVEAMSGLSAGATVYYPPRRHVFNDGRGFLNQAGPGHGQLGSSDAPNGLPALRQSSSISSVDHHHGQIQSLNPNPTPTGPNHSSSGLQPRRPATFDSVSDGARAPVPGLAVNSPYSVANPGRQGDSTPSSGDRTDVAARDPASSNLPSQIGPSPASVPVGSSMAQDRRRAPVPTASQRSQFITLSEVPADAADYDQDQPDLDSEDDVDDSFVEQFLDSAVQRFPRSSDHIIRATQYVRGTLTTKMVASASAISSLESVAIADLPENERTCVICYNDFGVQNPEGFNEAPLRLPGCKHVFGDHCIKKWFEDADSCPYCRHRVPARPRAMPNNRALLGYFRLRGAGAPGQLQNISDEELHFLRAYGEAPSHGRRSPPSDTEGVTRRRGRVRNGVRPQWPSASPTTLSTRPSSFSGPTSTSPPPRDSSSGSRSGGAAGHVPSWASSPQRRPGPGHRHHTGPVVVNTRSSLHHYRQSFAPGGSGNDPVYFQEVGGHAVGDGQESETMIRARMHLAAAQASGLYARQVSDAGDGNQAGGRLGGGVAPAQPSMPLLPFQDNTMTAWEQHDREVDHTLAELNRRRLALRRQQLIDELADETRRQSQREPDHQQQQQQLDMHDDDIR